MIYLMRIFIVMFSLGFLTSCKKEQKSLVVYNDGFQRYNASDLISKESYLLSQKPDLVLIMIGSNDVYNTTELPNYRINLLNIINTIKKAGASVMLLTPPPMDTLTRKPANLKLDSLCIIIRNLSIENNCYFFDVNTLFKKTGYEPNTLLFFDGLHPNAQGYELLSSNLFLYFKQQNLTSKKTICCFGDSITYGQSVTGEGTSTGNTYPGVLYTALNNKNP